MAEIYVEMKSWSDVNWYLQEGYYIGNPNGIVFPGYFTMNFDLNSDEQKEALKKLVLSAREKGIKITCNDDKVLLKIGLSLEDSGEEAVNVRLLSNGKVRPNIAKDREPIDFSNAKKEKTDKPEKDMAVLNERREQLRKCNAFFLRVANALKDTHEIVGSPFKTWSSAFLVPKGTRTQLSYNGKPFNSLRVACNWNWRASLNKCKDEKMIQCNTNDMPWCRRRKADGAASDPIWGNMVGYFDEDKHYHCVFGEKYDRNTKTWSWYEGDEKELIKKMHDRAVAKEISEASSNAEQDVSEEAVKMEVTIDEI